MDEKTLVKSLRYTPFIFLCCTHLGLSMPVGGSTLEQWNFLENNHQVTSEQGKNIHIKTSFVPVIKGEEAFLSTLKPSVTDAIGPLKNTFQSSAKGEILDRGCYSVSLEGNTQPRTIASSQDMAAAPSLGGRCPQGQGIALSSTHKKSKRGYLKFDFKNTPLRAFGSEIYANFESCNAYPKDLMVKLELENGEIISVKASTLKRKKNFPEIIKYCKKKHKNLGGQSKKHLSHGYFPYKDPRQGYGYLKVESSVPFRSLVLGFKSEHHAHNALFSGGVLSLYTPNSLLSVPNLPTDQLETIQENNTVYSATALSPTSEHPMATDQVLGNDCLQALSSLGLSSDPRSFFPVVVQNFFPVNDPSSEGESALPKGVSGSLRIREKSKNSLWIQPMGLEQRTAYSKASLSGTMMGYHRMLSDRWALGIFGGMTQEKNEVTYNHFSTKNLLGGARLDWRWQQDDLGPSVSQHLFFSQNRYENTRDVPMFAFQAEQKYRGTSGYSITHIKWTFLFPKGMTFTPYALLSYAMEHRRAFEETTLALPGAGEREKILSLRGALQFDAHTRNLMANEGGFVLKKHGFLAQGSNGELWISMAIGRVQVLKDTPYTVGFVDFSKTFDTVSNRINATYCAPMVGATWNLSGGCSLGMGGRFQQTLQRDDGVQENTWAFWLSLRKLF